METIVKKIYQKKFIISRAEAYYLFGNSTTGYDNIHSVCYNLHTLVSCMIPLSYVVKLYHFADAVIIHTNYSFIIFDETKERAGIFDLYNNKINSRLNKYNKARYYDVIKNIQDIFIHDISKIIASYDTIAIDGSLFD